MGFRTTSNRFYVMFHLRGGEARWTMESPKDKSPTAAEMAAELRYGADLIEWFEAPDTERGPMPERKRV